MSNKVKCDYCNGRGTTGTCAGCSGSGCANCGMLGQITCSKCAGTGRIYGSNTSSGGGCMFAAVFLVAGFLASASGVGYVLYQFLS